MDHILLMAMLTIYMILQHSFTWKLYVATYKHLNRIEELLKRLEKQSNERMSL